MLCHALATARRLDTAGSRRSICWSCSPLSIRRGSACRRRAASPRRSGCRRRADRLEACATLATAARALARSSRPGEPIPSCAPIAEAMERGGWGWARRCWRRCRPPSRGTRRHAAGLRAWTRLAEWAEHGAPAAARQRPGDGERGARPACASARRRCRAAAAASRLRRRGQRRLCAARPAPTGRTRSSPKPAPASARPSAISRRRASGPRRTTAPVWISTFTRNLQPQISGELDRLYPDPGGQASPRRRAQGPRELSVPPELRGGVAACRSGPGRAAVRSA